ncbi:hypothetical protein D9757_014532 [Collybiopsis confluens]|uniref:Uncharacterized protein n=1 Tax=Collybiopsis confluens TaxID=2823264 RepID=A0A8H5CMR5_9AGAR|nr:hypothetical protein D9757_014532 [Collybiopsis confluens]
MPVLGTIAPVHQHMLLSPVQSMPKSPVTLMGPTGTVMRDHSMPAVNLAFGSKPFHVNGCQSRIRPEVALIGVEEIFDGYVAMIGGSWSKFFSSITSSFIHSNNDTEIEDHYSEAQRWLQDIWKSMRVLEASASQAGDMYSLEMELGQGMVKRMGEITMKLRDLSHATLLGTKEFKKAVEDGVLTW